MPRPALLYHDRARGDPFWSSLTRRQLKLAVGCGAASVLMLLGMPIAHYLQPELLATRVAGFTLSWLVLGILFFPTVWVIAWIFIRRSMGLEENYAERTGLSLR